MPVVSKTSISTFARRLTAIACAAFLFSAAPALADCQSQPASTPFAQWGDTSNYFLVPGGSFEGSSDDPAWNLSNASLTPGNEPFYVNSATDGQSLTVNGGGVATSPWFCLDDTMSDLRLFAQESAPGSDLQVNLLVWWWHRLYTLQIADLADGSMPSWAPTSQIGLPTGNIPSGASVYAELQFVVPDGQASWQLDDVYVDPYRSG